MKKLSVTNKVFILTSILALANIALVVYQGANFVLTAWNIIPTLIVLMIFVGNILPMFRKTPLENTIDASSAGTSYVMNENSNKDKVENQDFYAINTSFPTKLTLMSIVVNVVAVILFCVLAFSFNFLKSSMGYDMVVTGNIVHQVLDGETYTEYSVSGMETTESRYLSMVVSYSVNDETFKEEIIDMFANTYRSDRSIDLCVKKDGTLVCAYDKIISYNVMFYTSIVCVVLALLSFILRLPNQYIVLLGIGFVGMGMIALFNINTWCDWLVKDLTTFGACFLNLGFISVVQMIALRITHMVGKRKDPNFKMD